MRNENNIHIVFMFPLETYLKEIVELFYSIYLSIIDRELNKGVDALST